MRAVKVLVLSPAPFASFYRSKQFLSLALGRLGHRVGYVEPPVSPLSLLRHPKRLGHLLGASRRAVAPGVEVWQPRVLPGQNSVVGQAVNARIIVRGARRLLPDPDITVAFALEARAAFARLGGVRVYYATDSLEDIPLVVERNVIRAREQELLDHADVVIACSPGLARQLRERTDAPVVYIPHGCDEMFLDFDPLRAVDPVELRGLPRPLVGYVGNVNARIDARLLDATRRATRAAGGTLVLIGGRFTGGPRFGDDLAKILADPALVQVAEQLPGDLPPYMAALDVGVTPYLDDAFNQKSYPLKIPQYLAMGAAVVSTPNGATEQLHHVVHTASEPEAFERAVLLAAADISPEAKAARRAAVAERTWVTVAEELLEACRRFRPAL